MIVKSRLIRCIGILVLLAVSCTNDDPSYSAELTRKLPTADEIARAIQRYESVTEITTSGTAGAASQLGFDHIRPGAMGFRTFSIQSHRPNDSVVVAIGGWLRLWRSGSVGEAEAFWRRYRSDLARPDTKADFGPFDQRSVSEGFDLDGELGETDVDSRCISPTFATLEPCSASFVWIRLCEFNLEVQGFMPAFRLADPPRGFIEPIVRLVREMVGCPAT